jgi:DNA-binding winged helix-turn-helix (wHTH) protein/Tol biopolymer transport system component
MSSPALSGPVYRFGVFEVDLRRRELLRRGTPVRLQDQPFRVLCMLLEKPGEVVTRDQLRQALWPSDTYVEFDGSLNAALTRLRFALGDSARNPTFIVTLPKHGYRFIAPVAVEEPGPPGQRVLDENASQLAVATIPRSAASANGRAAGGGAVHFSLRKRWMYLAIPCLAAILLHQIVYWLFPLPPPRMINRTRLTHIGNVDPGPIVMDGTRIFFCARRGARRFPVQTSINGGDAVEIKTPFENSTILDISPDHTSFLLGSVERIGDEYKLWVWPVQGGTPRRFGEGLCTDAVWSPDGRHVAFASKGTLYNANTDGSASRPLARKPAYNPIWSADGRKLRFSKWDPVMQVHSLWEVRADGSHLQQVFPGDEKLTDTSVGFWLAGGKYFAFLRGSFPHQKLWMTREWRSFWRRSSPHPFFVSTGADDTETVAGLGRNGTGLISVGYWPDRKLHRLSSDSHSLHPASIFPSAENLHFSRDGRWVAYSSTVDGSLWRCRADATNCLQLTSAPMTALEPRWSPDGTQLLFLDTQPNALRHLRVVAAQGSSPPKALGPLDLVAGLADWSPDGKQIILDMSAPPIEAPDYLYLIDVATGKTNLLPGSKGFHTPAWARDGRWIAAIGSSDTRIFLYSPRQKVWLPGPVGRRLGYPYWSYRSDDLFFQDLGAPGQPIYQLNPATGRKELSFSFNEALQKDAVTCRFAGIGLDDTLYALVIGATADLFAVDLDLP